jgi:hypothetical protein
MNFPTTQMSYKERGDSSNWRQAGEPWQKFDRFKKKKKQEGGTPDIFKVTGQLWDSFSFKTF